MWAIQQGFGVNAKVARPSSPVLGSVLGRVSKRGENQIKIIEDLSSEKLKGFRHDLDESF